MLINLNYEFFLSWKGPNDLMHFVIRFGQLRPVEETNHGVQFNGSSSCSRFIRIVLNFL